MNYTHPALHRISSLSLSLSLSLSFRPREAWRGLENKNPLPFFPPPTRKTKESKGQREKSGKTLSVAGQAGFVCNRGKKKEISQGERVFRLFVSLVDGTLRDVRKSGGLIRRDQVSTTMLFWA